MKKRYLGLRTVNRARSKTAGVAAGEKLTQRQPESAKALDTHETNPAEKKTKTAYIPTATQQGEWWIAQPREAQPLIEFSVGR